MKICACSICWIRDSRAGALDKARQAGFEAVELLALPKEIWAAHGDLRDLTAAELRREFSAAGLSLAALHLGAIMTSTEEKRRALTDYARRALEIASETGCRVVVEGGPDRAKEPFDPFLRSLEELVPLFERTPVKLALENHYLNSIQFPEDYERVFSEFDSKCLGMALNTGTLTSAKVDPEDVASRFASRIYHVHIKDHVGTRSVALGSGSTNNFGMARVLNRFGYSGYLSQELEVEDHENSDRYASEGFKYLQRLAETR